MPTQTPLTDAINALTTYANTVTGKTPPDTTLSDAVATLASGYGGGSVATSFALKDYKVPNKQWVMPDAVDNYIKTGGCVHIVVTVPPTSPLVSSANEIASIGRGELNAWSPTTNCSMFGAIYADIDDTGINSFNLRLRGSTLDGHFKTYPYADANGKIDLKLYSDRFVNVLTNTTTYYSSSSDFSAIATAMTNLCNYSYISIGCNQLGARWTGNIVSLFAIEAS